MPARIECDTNVYTVTTDGVAWPQHWRTDELLEAFVEATAEGRLFEHPLFRVAFFGERCDEATYRQRLYLKEWAREHSPNHPCLHPNRPMEPSLLPAEEF